VGRLATLHSDESRQVTVWALGLIGSEHVTRRELDALEQVLASEAPTWVRVTAIDALGKLGQEARPILEPLLHGADEESIQAARLALMDLERRR
jgi:HEAT repeat protein